MINKFNRIGLVYSSPGEYEKAITVFKNELKYRMNDPFVL